LQGEALLRLGGRHLQAMRVVRKPRKLAWLIHAAFGASLVASVGCRADVSYPVRSATVATRSGAVEGVPENGVMVYRGIPFAAPPVGRLRWREPQPPPKWSGIRRADRFSPICMQRGMYPPDAPVEPMSEDCLYLNIWAPAGAKPSSLPVMVWIYGGGLENGSASTPLYRGDRLARKGVVVVTFNYRLGVFGFLAHPELTRESVHNSSGNYGLLDQIAALRWVGRNIAGFGGDPHRVTVFGQSSGSISISVLTASPLARGLFERAIGESGGLFEPVEISSDYRLSGAEMAGQEFVRAAHTRSIAALRAMPAASLLAISFRPHPVLDSYVLADSPSDIYRARKEDPASLLIGSNAKEGEFFLKGRRIDPKNYMREIKRDFPSFLVDFLAPSPGATPATARDAAARFEGDMRFRWDMWHWARLGARDADPVFLYEFSRAPRFRPQSFYAGLGATHGVEMFYVFGHLWPMVANWAPQDRELADLVQSYWTNFAKTGNPNGSGLPRWPRFAARDGRLMVLGTPAHAAPVPDKASLNHIGDVYAAAGVVLGDPLAIVCGALAVLVAFALLLVLWLRRRRRAHRSIARRSSA
jgi:para-nitrobenzyl esterase